MLISRNVSENFVSVFFAVLQQFQVLFLLVSSFSVLNILNRGQYLQIISSLEGRRIKIGSVEVPNGNSISCSNSSLLERSPATQATRIRFLAETCLPRGALVEDGFDLGQVSPYW
jgi:hypothetical protein